MHKFLRQELKGYKGLLWIVFFAIGAQYLLIRAPRGLKETVVAKVNGESISAHEFNQQARKLQILMEKYSGGRNREISLDLLLQKVVKESLLLQSARKNGFFVGKELLSQEIFSLLPPFCFKNDGTLNMEAYQNRLSVLGETITSFEKEQEHRLQVGSLEELLAESVAIPDWLGNEYKKGRENQHKYALLTIPYKEVEQSIEKQEISDEVLSSFFQSNQEVYRLPEAKKVRYFSLSFDDFKKHVSFSDEELESYYHKNKYRLFTDRPDISVRHIVINKMKEGKNNALEAKNKAEELLKALKNEPGSFETLAKKESDDAATAKKGGFYGVIKKDVLPGAVERAAHRLREPGDLSSVIDTKDSLVILQLVERIEKQPKDFASVRSEIIEALKKEQTDRRLLSQVRSIVRAARQEGSSLEQVSKELNGVWKEDFIQADQSFESDDVMQSLKIALFAKGIKKGSISSATSKSGVVLFEVLDVVPSEIPSFKEAKEKVKAAFIAQEAKKEAKLIAKEIHQKMLAGQAINTLGYKVSETGFLDASALRKEIKKFPGLKKEVLFLTDKKQVMRAHDDKAYYLIQLVDVAEKSSNKPSGNKKAILSLLEEERKRMAQEAFIAYLEKNATIVYNNKQMR